MFWSICTASQLSYQRNNLLDIFATNRPALSQQVQIIPGLSDHEIIKVVSKLSVPVSKPKEH